MKTNTRLFCICLGAAACLSIVQAIPFPNGHAATLRLSTAGAVTVQDVPPGRLSSAEAQRVIADRAGKVMLALKAGNMSRFSSFVHPGKGVRFSPYANVEPGGDRVFTRKQAGNLWAGTKRYLWGAYDGSGEPIRLTFKAYHKRFIYDRDFARAKQVGYNAGIMGAGNTLNNIRESYPQGILVEYHFPGASNEMDWKSLWLVFEKQGSTWYVVGVVHDEWTI